MTVDFTKINPNKMGVYKAFRKNGDGTNSAIEDYSDLGEGLTEFWIAPPENEVWFINRLIIQIRDKGTIDADGYGNGDALTNGVRLFTKDGEDNLLLDMMDGGAVLANAGWGLWAFNTVFSTFGSGDEFLSVEWAFARFGVPIVLNGALGQKFVASFNDDLTDLVDHFFFAHGWNENLNSDGKPLPFSNRGN